MYKFLTKNGQMLAVGVSVFVIAVFLITTMVGMSSAGYTSSTNLIDYKSEITFFDLGLYLTIGLLIIAVCSWLLFAVYQLASNPKKSLKFIVGGAVIFAIFLVFYFMTDTAPTGRLAELVSKNNLSESVQMLISGGLNTALSLAGISVVVMLVSEFMNIFK
jgi:hypothetical protein